MAVAPERTRLTWDYSPAPESADHVRLRDSFGVFVGGEFADPRSGKSAPTVNPATEEQIAQVAVAGEDDIARAVKSAREAQRKWANLPGLERGKYLFRIARLIQERARELAVVETMDGGKPIRESRDIDIPLAAAHFFHYAGWADKIAYGIAGREFRALNYDQIPGCTYCDPEIGSVGLSEAKARARGYDVRVGTFKFGVLGRAKIAGETEGFVKIVAEKKYDELLGVHMIGLRSTELVAEATMALQLESTVEDLIRTIHAHPTMAEAVGEAAHATHGAAIHL